VWADPFALAEILGRSRTDRVVTVDVGNGGQALRKPLDQGGMVEMVDIGHIGPEISNDAGKSLARAGRVVGPSRKRHIGRRRDKTTRPGREVDEVTDVARPAESPGRVADVLLGPTLTGTVVIQKEDPHGPNLGAHLPDEIRKPVSIM
jgi:hypothetical protein